MTASTLFVFLFLFNTYYCCNFTANLTILQLPILLIRQLRERHSFTSALSFY